MRPVIIATEYAAVLLKDWISPICIIFAVILTGYYLGKIRIMEISLDLAGVLITAVIFGVVISAIPEFHLGEAVIRLYSDEFAVTMKFLSSFGTSLFVAAIGLSAGYGIMFDKLNLAKYFIFGAFAVLLNFLLMLIVSKFDIKTTPFLMYGIFCGAMTSTPGLAAVCESTDNGASAAVAGYGGAYIFGVIGAVLFVQIISRKTKEKNDVILNFQSEKINKTPEFNGLIQISLVIVLGCLAGALYIPITGFSLGNSGGIMLVGIFVGAFVMRTKSKAAIPNTLLSTVRGLGLVLFFVGSGIPAGLTLISCINISVIIYGIIFTAVPIALGYGMMRYAAKKTKFEALTVVCGVMTSTPAMGVLLRKMGEKSNTAVYSAVYTGALLAMIISMRLVI